MQAHLLRLELTEQAADEDEKKDAGGKKMANTCNCHCSFFSRHWLCPMNLILFGYFP